MTDKDFRQMEKDSALRTPHSELLIKVEMGEGVVSEAPDIITTVGCGSCVILTLYDAVRKIGGLAHVMLPSQVRNVECGIRSEKISPLHQGEGQGGVYSALRTSQSAFQFASTALPALLDEMQKRGCSRQNITAKITGGAKMFSSYSDFRAGIGEQNVKSIRQLLEREEIPLVGWDTGGRHGRSIEFYLDSGRLVVKAFEREDREI